MLLFDIGNTRLKWALLKAGSMVSSGTIGVAEVGAHKLAQCFDALTQLDSAWVANVGPIEAFNRLQLWLGNRFQIQAHLVRGVEPMKGFHNDYKDASELGVDRWLAAIGARCKVARGDLIVIDIGTAITIDWLSDKNVFGGGVILPGLVLLHSALLDGTSGIKSEISDVAGIIGKTTRECVNSGIVYGLAGAIERIVEEMRKTISRPTTLVFTGGGACAIAEKIRLDGLVEPNLVLQGLHQLALRKAAAEAR